MDLAITLITPEIMRQRGAQAFDEKRTLDDHDMNPDASTLADWKTGWLARHHEVTVKANGNHGRSCPP